MKVISPANATVMQMLKNFRKPGTSYRKLKYLVDTEVDDGILLLNMFTRELVLLSKEEYENAAENEYLRQNWFVVPEECDEKAYVDLVKSFLRSRKPILKEITGYTIFTTTDCNARCFYCFEAGRSRIPMSKETAQEVVGYILNHCNGKKVSIRWFGGEPLMNQDAINIISQGLQDAGIEYKSSMVTNGYLFDDNTVNMAVNLWNLEKVQITLDGTEEIYNKIKAFVYPDGNPFEIVLNNIQRVLDAGIHLSIRLNMDLYNADDLLQLTKALCARFAEYENLAIYAHHLFDTNKSNAELHSEQEWAKRNVAMAHIEAVINQYNLSRGSRISPKFKINNCMADSGHSVTILPDGHIGLCEHHSDGEFIGHIESNQFDLDMVKSFSEPVPEIPECASCFNYPDCLMLKRCSTSNQCYPQHISRVHKQVERAMKYTYQKTI